MAGTKNINKFIRVMLAALLVCGIVMTAGCALKPADPSKTTTGIAQPPSPTGETQTTAPTQILFDSSLSALRQAMAETPQTFAVAYFGCPEIIDRDAQADPFAILQENAYRLCKDLPFLTEIPQDRIVGETGDLYCIVPKDENATVAVNKGVWVGDSGQLLYQEVIYRRESGEPILLFCNSDGWEPDTEVVITDSDGTVTTWYPQLDDNKCVMPLRNHNREDLFFDFSPYREMLMAKHSQLKDAQWVLPTAEMLAGSAWQWTGYLKDYREVRYRLEFQEETLSVFWKDGIDETGHEYLYAPWELTYDEGFATLAIDFGEFASVLRYNLLYNEEFNQLYVGTDTAQEGMPVGREPLYRFLSRSIAPEPTEMIGTWELAWTEVEGDRNEAEPGSCSIVIRRAASGGLIMRYISQEFPYNNFEHALLTIDMREMYPGCGNDAWVADLDCVGPYDTTYAVTLTADGSLLKQNYFLLDGAPTVSYECFIRVGE